MTHLDRFPPQWEEQFIRDFSNATVCYISMSNCLLVILIWTVFRTIVRQIGRPCDLNVPSRVSQKTCYCHRSVNLIEHFSLFLFVFICVFDANDICQESNSYTVPSKWVFSVFCLLGNFICFVHYALDDHSLSLKSLRHWSKEMD